MAEPEVGANPYQQLLKRFGITLLLGVVVYRLGALIPVPGLDVSELKAAISGDGMVQGALQWANMFNGGALANGSLFGLGIMPYISASIIIQLMASSFPLLKQLKKEGEVGQRKINQYTRYTTVGICLVQSALAAVALTRMEGGKFLMPGVDPTHFVAQTIIIVTCGSMVLLWLAEQVTKLGIGNGVSVMIMISILASFPGAIAGMFADDAGGTLPTFLMTVVIFLAIIASMVVLTQARRFINMEQQRRVQGNRVYGGAQTKLPLMLNHAGVIPVIFASPVMVVVVMLLGYAGLASLGDQAGPGYRYIFCAMIIGFTYFYISITVDLNEWSNNFRQSGFFVRGIKPGRNTAEYLKRILMRITFVGSITLAAVTIVPTMVGEAIGLSSFVSQMVLGGIGLLIVVGVSLDVIQKVGGFLMAQQYQGMAAGAGGLGGGNATPSVGKGKGKGAKRF